MKNLEKEEWKLVEGSNNFYVSNMKRIKRILLDETEELSDKIRTIDGKEVSQFKAFKELWDIDILYTGDLVGEEWRKTKYADDIEVSNKGRIRTNNWRGTGTKKILKTWYVNGYVYCNFLDNSGNIKKTPLHRLIAECFIPNPNCFPEIDHINAVRDDNRIENLRWVNHKENMNNPITKMKKRRA